MLPHSWNGSGQWRRDFREWWRDHYLLAIERGPSLAPRGQRLCLRPCVDVRTRHGNAEGRAVGERAFHIHEAAVRIHNGLHDHETEAESARILPRGLPEAIEQVGDLIFGNTGASIANADTHAARLQVHAHSNLAAIWRELH